MQASGVANGSCKPAMPGPDVARGQFLRVEKFAIEAPRGKPGGNNITKVANEAVRTEGYCPHIETPVPPTLLYGISPIAAAERAKNWARVQTDYVRHPSSQVQLARKFRVDKPCALVGVISAPPEWEPGETWAHFCDQSLQWLKRKYGDDRLCSVLEHRDERWLHLHFWVVPRPGEGFSSIHQGEKALDDIGRNAARILRDAAYKKAMAQLLDEFNREVGRHFGLQRENVGGKRYSREDWQRKQLLDKKRESDIQRRIDDAVAAAKQQVRLEQIAIRKGTDSEISTLCFPVHRPNARFEPTTPVPIQPQMWLRPRNR